MICIYLTSISSFLVMVLNSAIALFLPCVLFIVLSSQRGFAMVKQDCLCSIRMDNELYVWLLKRSEFYGLPFGSFVRSILLAYKRNLENGNEKTTSHDFI